MITSIATAVSMRTKWRPGAALALAALLGPALSGSDCYTPDWQEFSAPSLGVTMEVTTDVHIKYGIALRDFVGVEVRERARSGKPTEERCSSFNFEVIDFSPKSITNAAGLLQLRANKMVNDSGLSNFKVVKNETFTFQGLPAREVIFSFNIEYFGTPATHRYVMVVSGSRLYTFGWVWGDAGPVPADSKRIFSSIRLTTPAADPHARSRALLEDTIRHYYLNEEYPEEVHFSSALRAIADRKREAESKMVKAYSYPQEVKYLRTENGYRVFRVEHSDAVVDWSIADDGKQITGLTWKKIRDVK